MDLKTIVTAVLLLSVPAIASHAQQAGPATKATVAESSSDEPDMDGPAYDGRMPPNLPDEDAGERPALSPMGEGPGSRNSKSTLSKSGKTGKDAYLGGPMPGPMGEMPTIEDLISDVRKVDAAFADKLKKMRKDQPFEFFAALRNAAPALIFAKVENDKETLTAAIRVFVLETEVRELAMQYKSAKADKSTIRKQLSEKVSQLFDRKLAIDELRVTKLAREVEDLKVRNAKRKAAKASLVNDRVQEILGEKETW
jgi:hypothetical protein